MASLTDRIDALFAEWDRPDSPGAAVGVVHDGGLARVCYLFMTVNLPVPFSFGEGQAVGEVYMNRGIVHLGNQDSTLIW